MGADRRYWPLWVQIGLWGLPRRGAAWVCFWLSVGLVAVCAALGLLDWQFLLVAALGLLAPVWYYTAIRWVDKHGGWERKIADE